MQTSQDLLWYVIVFTAVTLTTYALYSLFLSTPRSNVNKIQLGLISASLVVLASACVWFKVQNTNLWRAIIELIRMSNR